ncbi:hypothetical protein J2794_005698 [Paraburkholderia terricola]|nr:hypothetical protein [Paraburkholderia terricola]
MCKGTDSRCTTIPSKPGDPLQSWRCEPLSLPTFFAAAKKVGAAPHRGNANRPLTNQGKAKPAANSHKAHTPKPYKTRAIIDKTTDKTSVDINGNGYSRPKIRNVTSPGIRPMPIFLSHGQQADNTATAMKVVNNQRIIANP